MFSRYSIGIQITSHKVRLDPPGAYIKVSNALAPDGRGLRRSETLHIKRPDSSNPFHPIPSILSIPDSSKKKDKSIYGFPFPASCHASKSIPTWTVGRARCTAWTNRRSLALLPASRPAPRASPVTRTVETCRDRPSPSRLIVALRPQPSSTRARPVIDPKDPESHGEKHTNRYVSELRVLFCSPLGRTRGPSRQRASSGEEDRSRKIKKLPVQSFLCSSQIYIVLGTEQAGAVDGQPLRGYQD